MSRATVPRVQNDANALEAESVLRELASAFPLIRSIKPPSREQQELAAERGVNLPEVDARYQTLVEQIPAVVFMAFLDKGIGEAYVSPQIEEILGFTQEEWLNDPVRWYQQIHPEDKARWSVEAADLFLLGKPLKSLYRVMARNGRIVWFHCEAKMVRNDDGRPWFIHGVAFDISDLKKAEEALKKNEVMLRGLFESAPDTVVVINSSGQIARINAQVERMFGYSGTELLGKSIEVLIPERFRSSHVRHREGYIVEPHTRPMGAGLELSGRRKDGSEFPVDIMLSPMEVEGGSMVIGVVRDITRRKQAETALQEYAERLKFLSRRLMDVQEIERRNIARELHDEIGQVLTGLKLTLELGTRLAAEDVGSSLNQARMLVNELMARARKLSLDLRPAMLDDLGLLPALLWHIEHYTAQTQIRVNFKHSGLEGNRLAPEVETAAYRIVQEALTNVARHASVPDATVRIWTNHQKLWIEVKDSGTGFDPEVVTASSESSGLAGMRERATLLGGQLLIESKIGCGTQLTAELSISEAAIAEP
ncbi:MAG TPA: PAS domain S-box protein [Pyrinomonadaceae bacterium]